MIRVTGNNSLLMSSLNTDTDNDTKVVKILKKSAPRNALFYIVITL